MTRPPHDSRGRAPVEPSDLIRLIDLEIDRRQLASDPGRATEIVVNRFLIPRFSERGVAALERLVAERTSHPHVASALVQLTGRVGLDTLSLFTRGEVIAGALSYLSTRYSYTHDWAWSVMWGLGSVTDEDQWDLVLELIARAPDDDESLWMIGDGPLARLQMLPDGVRRIDDLAKTSPKVARILKLVNEIP